MIRINELLKKPRLFEVYAITIYYTVTLSVVLLSGSYNGVY